MKRKAHRSSYVCRFIRVMNDGFKIKILKYLILTFKILLFYNNV